MDTDKYKRLRLARNEINYKQTKVAKELKLSLRAYTRYESGEGEREITSKVLEFYAQKGININWLLTGEGEMFARPSAREGVPAELAPRVAAIVGLLSDIPEEQVDEVYKYISKEKRLADLEKTVEELKAKTG